MHISECTAWLRHQKFFEKKIVKKKNLVVTLLTKHRIQTSNFNFNFNFNFNH